AHDLLEIVTQLGSKREYAVALAMARKSQFEGRLLAVLDPRRNRAGLSRAAVFGTAVLALALLLPLAALQAQEQDEAQPAQPAQAPAAAREAATDTAMALPRWRRKPPVSPEFLESPAFRAFRRSRRRRKGKAFLIRIARALPATRTSA